MKTTLSGVANMAQYMHTPVFFQGKRMLPKEYAMLISCSMAGNQKCNAGVTRDGLLVVQTTNKEAEK